MLFPCSVDTLTLCQVYLLTIFYNIEGRKSRKSIPLERKRERGRGRRRGRGGEEEGERERIEFD